MSQDSENRTGPRREGERPNRPAGRREDGPRFNRRNDAGEPRFDRKPKRTDSPRESDFRRSEPRPGRYDSRSERNFRRDDDRPRFERNDERPRRFERKEAYPRRFERSDDRPARRWDDSERPRNRFDRDSPTRGRTDDRRDSGFRPTPDRPRFERQDDRPRFNRTDERPRRFDRDDDRPRRFERQDERPARRWQENDRPQNRYDDKPRFGRRREQDADERPNRFSRNPNRHDYFERPSAYSPDQRKDSGDRRTGTYKKAPNYNVEAARPTRIGRTARTGKDKGKPAYKEESDTIRLNRYIANAGLCSRREADELIARGNISVNGKTITEMGYQVNPGDTVKYGTKILNPERFVYVLLNKPKDYITTTDDPEERKTVMELVADAGNFRLYPVGRLDRNTTGLLLLTNDGELAAKLTHPSSEIGKIYQAELNKPISEEDFETLKKGITLDDGPIKPDAISIITPDAHVVGIEIHSGRNRIVRRMFEQLGYEVTKLDRTTYAGLTKKELPRGKWRFLEPKEVVKLKFFKS